MKVLSPAKINLFLETGPYEGGLHRIISLVDIVDLYDIVELEESACTEVKFLSEWSIPDKNTVTKSISALKEIFRIEKNVRITINKKIPPGGGLGGGSSNAATVIKALAEMWKIRASNKMLMEIALKIGSDVPLFIMGKRCLVEGFGEKITSKGVSPNTLAYYFLVPPFSVSTGDVYRENGALKKQGDLTEGARKIKILNECIMRRDIAEIEANMFNRLGMSYFSLWREGKEVKERAERRTGKRFFVSGSGGTLFSVFLCKDDAEEMAKILNIDGWRGYVVESIQTS